MTETRSEAMTLTATTSDTVLPGRRGFVTVLTLDRPNRLNAWTDELEDRYFALLDAADPIRRCGRSW